MLGCQRCKTATIKTQWGQCEAASAEVFVGKRRERRGAFGRAFCPHRTDQHLYTFLPNLSQLNRWNCIVNCSHIDGLVMWVAGISGYLLRG
jgi:hypothetical protein